MNFVYVWKRYVKYIVVIWCYVIWYVGKILVLDKVEVVIKVNDMIRVGEVVDDYFVVICGC